MAECAPPLKQPLLPLLVQTSLSSNNPEAAGKAPEEGSTSAYSTSSCWCPKLTFGITLTHADCHLGFASFGRGGRLCVSLVGILG